VSVSLCVFLCLCVCVSLCLCVSCVFLCQCVYVSDKYTLQHTRYPNIFSLGDASSLPTSRTGAAIRKQAPVLVKNLVAAMRGKPLTARYDGYAACPIVTGYGRLIMAEFDYDGTPKESFPFDQSKERYSMYLLKAYGLPVIYWHGILKGRL